MTHATITGLNLYPLKSSGAIALERATLGTTGLEGDRRWLVVTPTGRFLTQRQLPRLALVSPTLTGTGLSLAAPDMPPLALDRDPEGPSLEVTIFSDRCPALDAGDEAAGWLSRFLGEPVRLVRFDPRGGRTTNPEWGGASVPIEFPDGFPLLVLSEGSVADLNSRLAAPVPINRFRPNIILGDLPPYAEDRIGSLSDGPVRLDLVWPCGRCKITTVDQEAGRDTGPEPLATLRSYRAGRPTPGAFFGHYAIIAAGVGAELQVGQRLAIEWREHSASAG